MINISVKDFATELSAKKPVPGGGGAAALAGVLAASLSSMVVNYTLGKKRYEKYSDRLENVINKSINLRDDLLNLINEDAKVFAPLAKAYKLPKDTQEQIAHKESVMEQALLGATKVPLDIAIKSCKIISLFQELLEISSKMVLSDVGVGVAMAQSALKSAVLNIYINTQLMKNRQIAEEFNIKAKQYEYEYGKIAEYIYCNVSNKLKQ